VLRARWGSDARRLHFAGAGDETWVRAAALYRYELAADPFEPWPEAEGQWVAAVAVVPLAVVPMGDLVAAHAAAGVELRFDTDLPARRAEVLTSGLPFSIVRWHRR